MAKGLVATKKTVTLKPGDFHFHACTDCGHRYGDNCRTPAQNGTCGACRSGFDRPLWERNQDPRDCCYENARQCDATTRQHYLLGGDTDWYKCTICSRTIPYKPVKPPQEEQDEYREPSV